MASIETKKNIRLSKSCIGSSEKKAVERVLNNEYLGMGNEVKVFEKALTEFFHRETLCVVNGTAALHLAVQALDIGIGDEVLLPSLTYLSSFQAISATGAKPVACDINEKTLVLDLEDAAMRLTPKTKAIMPVHYSGGVGDFNSIIKFANKNNLRIIEDAAHAFGTIYENKRIGSFGDITCFSFDGIKNITSGEGGCVVSDDKEVLKRIKDARLLGIENDTDKRFSGKRSWNFDVTKQGWRYHMSNIMAAIGIEQLRRFPILAKKRQNFAKLYDELFIKESLIQPISRDYNNIVPHIYVVQINELHDRDDIRNKLLKKGIETGYHYQPNHYLTIYKTKNQRSFPVTESVFPKLISLPLHPDLSKNDVHYVAESIKTIVNKKVG